MKIRYKYLKDRHEITLLCKKYPGAQDQEVEGLRHIFVGTESKSLTRTLLSYAYHAALFVKRHGQGFDIIIEEFSPAIPTFLHAFTKKPIILQVQGYTGNLYFRKYNPAYAFFLYTLEYLRPRFYNNFIFISSETAKKLLSENLSPSSSLSSVKVGGTPLNPLLIEGRVPSQPLREDEHPEPLLPKERFKACHVSYTGEKRCIEVIPNGISPELLEASSEDGDYILYIGRIDIYGKGLDILIKAYKEFYKSFPDVRLVIAGDGRDMNKFRSELMELPLETRSNIELLGWVTGNQKTEVLRKAMFCVFPSRHEVQSIVALEAMACGKALIVSDIEEFSFIYRNGAGVLFNTGDAASLLQKLKDLMIRSDRHEMGNKGKAMVSEYTWDKISLLYEQFLLTVSGGANSAFIHTEGHSK